MAEKEERIRGELRVRINQFLWPTCKECGSKCKDEEEIKFCRDSQPGITRQEAIERIAKKICAYSWETLNELAQARYMERAQAALNALLGE